MDTVIMWQGAGWYAPRAESGSVWYYFCGSSPAQEPDTYPMGLGTPDWFDAPPVGWEVK